MRWLADLRIRTKLTLITVLTIAIALLLAGVAIIAYDNSAYRAQKTGEISAQAGVLAASVTASLEFNDPKAARDYLNPLEANTEITAAGVYASNGSLFASYSRAGARSPPPSAEPQVQRFEGDELVVFAPVRQGQRQVGTVYLRASTETLAVRITRFGGIILLVMTGSLLLTLPIAMRLHSVIERQINEVAQVLAVTTGEILATTTEVASGAAETASAVSETTSTVKELDASSRQSATQAESMAEAARQSLDVTQEGIRLANQVSASMTGLKQKVGSVAEQILRLSEQAAQIGGIAKVVGELAGETNMLALNAAVEAARAGEHGKGFAVVAAEIRKLADQTKKSAERSNALVAEIQKATNSAVMVTEEGSRTADEVAAIIDKTLAAFGSISTTVSSVSVGAQQVLLNSQQQAAALGQVTEAMKSLAAGSTQMAAGTAQTKIGVQKLNSVALDLKAMV